MNNETGRRVIDVLKRYYKTDERAYAALETVASMLADAASKINLTALDTPEETALLHIYDSLLVSRCTDFAGRSVIDIGCGGGFPTFPIAAVLRPEKVTALDATAKKLAFVESAAREAGLDNIVTLCGRAEELGREKEHREAYDIAVARGVARLNVLAEWALPFVRVGGMFIAMKGPKGDEETAQAGNAIRLLGGEVLGIERCEIPVFGHARTLVCIKKLRPAPGEYPRSNARIMKKPL